MISIKKSNKMLDTQLCAYYRVHKQLTNYTVFLLEYVNAVCHVAYSQIIQKDLNYRCYHCPKRKSKLCLFQSKLLQKKRYRDYLGQSSNVWWHSSLLQKISTISLPCLPAGQLDALTLKSPSLTYFSNACCLCLQGSALILAIKNPLAF